MFIFESIFIYCLYDCPPPVICLTDNMAVDDIFYRLRCSINVYVLAHRCGNTEAVDMLLWRYDIDVNVQACDGRRMITGAYGENALIEAVMYRR